MDKQKTTIKKEMMIEALEKSLGVVSTACEKVGINRGTHYSWLNEDADYKKRVDDISEMSIDFVESKLFQQIEKGNTVAIIFYLKTKAKQRGYIERTEITPINHEPFVFEVIRNKNEK